MPILLLIAFIDAYLCKLMHFYASLQSFLLIIQFHFIYCQVLHESICLPRKSLLPMRLGYTITVTKLDT